MTSFIQPSQPKFLPSALLVLSFFLLGPLPATARGLSTCSLEQEIDNVIQRIQALDDPARLQDEVLYLAFLKKFFEAEKDLTVWDIPLARKVNDRLRGYYRWWRKNPQSILTPKQAYRLFVHLHEGKKHWRNSFALTRQHSTPGSFYVSDSDRHMDLEMASDNRFYLRMSDTLGEGQSKEFRIALSLKTFEEVARLELKPGAARDPKKFAEFVKERKLIEQISQCNDPTKIHGLAQCFGTSNTVLFAKLYAQPLADSTTVKSRKNQPTLNATFEEKLRGGIQILTGLINLKLHFGTIHLDIKPDNVFFSKLPSGYDFGVSDLGIVRTQEDLIGAIELPSQGTPYFMAPELIWRREAPKTEPKDIPEIVYRTASYSSAFTLQVLLNGGSFPSFLLDCPQRGLTPFSNCMIKSIVELEKELQNSPNTSWLELIHLRGMNRHPMERPNLETLRRVYEWRQANFPLPEAQYFAEPLACAGVEAGRIGHHLLLADRNDAIQSLQNRPIGSYSLYPLEAPAEAGRVGTCKRIGITYVAPHYVYKPPVSYSNPLSRVDQDGSRLVHQQLLSNTAQATLAEEELSILEGVGILKANPAGAL